MSDGLFQMPYEQEGQPAPSVSLESVVSGIIPSKKAIYQVSDHIAMSVQDGDVDPIALDIKLKFIIETLTLAREKIRDEVVTQVMKFGKEGVQKFEAQVEVVEAGIKYDYSACGDAEMHWIASQLSILNDKKKEREKFLKAIKKPLSINDQGTGEVLTICPPLRTSTTTIKTTWK